jgi:hypothetical protein
MMRRCGPALMVLVSGLLFGPGGDGEDAAQAERLARVREIEHAAGPRAVAG